MGHTRESIIKEVDDFFAAGAFEKLYDQGFVKRRGPKGRYMAFAAERLLEHSDTIITEMPKLKDVIPVRKDTYNVPRDGTTPHPADGRKGEKVEDRIAMELYNQGALSLLGKVIHYQTPLKDGRDSAIDLLTYDGDNIYILELKRPDSQETLLRCVLEAYTYYCMADKEKLVHDFQEKFQTADKSKKSPCVRKAALVYQGSRPHADFCDTSVKKLMNLLGVDLFLLDDSNRVVKPYCHKDLAE